MKVSLVSETDNGDINQKATTAFAVSAPNQQEFLDTQEQDKIIKDLKQKCISDIQKSSTFLSTICYILACLSFMTVLLHKIERKFKWYPIYAALLHLGCGKIAVSDMKLSLSQLKEYSNQKYMSEEKNIVISLLIGITAAASPLILCKEMFQSTGDWFPWILCASNIYTFIIVFIMHKDSMNTIMSVKELKESKYKHKSL